jgi:hypothetical protein
MARQKGSRTGHCQGCNHVERARIERLLAAGASIKGTARKFDIDYHALRRHWISHVPPEARAAYIAGAGATKDQLEAIVADESFALVDHYRITSALPGRYPVLALRFSWFLPDTKGSGTAGAAPHRLVLCREPPLAAMKGGRDTPRPDAGVFLPRVDAQRGLERSQDLERDRQLRGSAGDHGT